MPPEDVPAAPQAPNVNVNVGNGRGIGASLGLFGIWEKVSNFTAVVIIVGLFIALTIWNRVDWQADRAADRSERVEERTLFREAIKDMNAEQNRRTGEVKGAVDVNTSVMRDLIAEFKAARSSGTIKHDAAVPKPGPPP